ncbi:uncharacterized protein [Apostichopus japonicus]|uniref:uncharacterized protein n=1 Tax=Stichopus japonicus TaxID=307972 RepID=UPI003AB56900
MGNGRFVPRGANRHDRVQETHNLEPSITEKSVGCSLLSPMMMNLAFSLVTLLFWGISTSKSARVHPCNHSYILVHTGRGEKCEIERGYQVTQLCSSRRMSLAWMIKNVIVAVFMRNNLMFCISIHLSVHN